MAATSRSRAPAARVERRRVGQRANSNDRRDSRRRVRPARSAARSAARRSGRSAVGTRGKASPRMTRAANLRSARPSRGGRTRTSAVRSAASTAKRNRARKTHGRAATTRSGNDRLAAGSSLKVPQPTGPPEIQHGQERRGAYVGHSFGRESRAASRPRESLWRRIVRGLSA